VAIPVQGHPAVDELEAFSRGTLADDAASQAISSHLESCPECLRTLGNLSSDTLESLVRAADLPAEVQTPSGSSQDATNATAVFGAATAGDAEADDLSFLAPPQGSDEIGRLGLYRVLKVLGSGGMGVVFQAEDIQLKRRVALKVLKSQAASRPRAKERFLREAQAAAAIEHDHIVTIHQVGEAQTDHGSVPFLAMQWLKGQSLEDRLKQGGILKPVQVVHLGRQIALGLAAAHEQGLIHRDIKPGNIWLEAISGQRSAPSSDSDRLTVEISSLKAFRVKILDFGLARSQADDIHLTQSGAIVGTPAYMAPEQGRGDPVDHRCDLFSLGVVLYRLTTGRLPFRGNTTMAVLTSLAMDQPEPPRSLVGDLPAELSDLIVQLLAKDPAQRPASAHAVAERLQAIEKVLDTPAVVLVSGGVVSGEWSSTPAADPPRTTHHLPLTTHHPPPKRRLAIAAALGALALLVAGVVFFLQTPNGTIRIEINDDSIEAVLTKSGVVIKGADRAHDIHVAAGEQGLKIKRGDLEFETDKFVLKKGETIRLKIELLPGKVQVVQGDRVIGERPLGNDRTAAEWVLSRGGTVIIDDGKERAVSAARDLPVGPWILRRVDLKYNKQVDDASLKELAGLKSLHWLDLQQTEVTVAGMKELAGLKSLQELNLTGTKLTDAGLKELARQTNFRGLDLGATKVTDTGLLELAGQKRLQYLNLRGTKVTPKGIAALQRVLPGCWIANDVTPAAAGSDRRAAEWVLSLGGTVTIDDGKERAIGAAKDLPAGPWTLRKIVLHKKNQATDAGLKQLGGLKNLHYLDLWATPVTDAGLKELAGLKNLQSLNLGWTKVSDAGLKELAGPKSLQTLDLSFTKVTGAGLKELAGLKSLQTLDLGWTKVTDAGLKELARLKSLQDLSLRGTKVEGAGLTELVGLERLQLLDLGGTKVTNARLRDLAGLKSLQVLSLESTQVTDAGLKELAGLKNVQVLDLRTTQVTDAGLKELAGLKRLHRLYLGGTQVTAQGIATLQKTLPGCRIDSDVTPAAAGSDRRAAEWVLSLGGTVTIDDGKERALSSAKDLPAGPWRLHTIVLCDKQQVTGASLKELAGLKTLQGLDLARTKVTDAALKELAGLESLQVLNLNGTPVSNAGLKELVDLKGLSWLSLWDTPVSDAGLKELANLKGLQWLSLGNTKVTDAGLMEFANLKGLQTLNLWGTPVTDAGLVHLQNLTKLKTLDLTKTKVTAKGIATLHRVLPGCQINSDVAPAVAGNDRRAANWALSLGGTVTIDDGKRAISAAKDLPAGTWTLRTIDLRHSTRVTDAGLEQLAGLQGFKALGLGGTKVTDAGLKELAGLKSLQILDLRDTKVTDAGLKELAGFKSLQILSLWGTQITGTGLKELTGLKSLQSLDLGKNAQVTDAVLKELAGLKSLQTLYINATKVTDAGLKELAGLQSLQTLNLSLTQIMDGGAEGAGRPEEPPVAGPQRHQRDGRGAEGSGWR